MFRPLNCLVTIISIEQLWPVIEMDTNCSLDSAGSADSFGAQNSTVFNMGIERP